MPRIARSRTRGLQSGGRSRRLAGAIVGLVFAGIGVAILALHATEIALTGHVWNVVAQGMLIGGGVLGLSQLWGAPKRRRR